MAKQVKGRWIGARVDDTTVERIKLYVEAVDLNMGDLIRVSIDEYIRSHPIKQPEPIVSIKPGE